MVLHRKIVSTKKPEETLEEWLEAFNAWGTERRNSLERYLIQKV